jgi:hypothetical protein
MVGLEPPPKPKVGPSKVARMLALGHKIVRLVDAGLLEDLADAAELLGFSRARVTQIVDLTLLAPDIQEALLFGEENRLSERKLRGVVTAGEWGEQWNLLGAQAELDVRLRREPACATPQHKET